MPAERYYCDQPLVSGARIRLEGSEHHHLVHVMRAREGEKIEIVNGKGALAVACVESLGRRDALVELESVSQVAPPKKQVVIAQALPRMNRLDFILEKGTELGMTGLLLFPGRLSERKELSPAQIERSLGVMCAAMKQCGRLYLPRLQWCKNIEQVDTAGCSILFGDVDPAAPMLARVLQEKPLNDILFFVGPESGFTDEEERYLRSIGTGVKLHHNILRTDTASLTALSVLSQYLTDH